MDKQAAGAVSRRAFLAASSGVVAAGVLGAGSTASASVRAGSTAGPGVASSATWGAAEVVLNDACADMTSAGWTVTAPEAGVYALDSGVSMGNPFNVPLPAVASGNYLIHADQTSVPGNTYVQMSHPLDVGAGAWRLDLRAKINDIPYVYEYSFARGIYLTVTANHYSFSFTIVNKDQFKAATGAAGIGYTRTLPIPFDGQFHEWSFVFDGSDTTMVLIDDVVISRFRQVNLTSSAADSIKILGAVAAQGKSGALDIEMSSVQVRHLPTAAALGDGSNLVGAGWRADPAGPDAYITDYAKSSGTVSGMKAAPKGEVLLYGAAGAVAAKTAAKGVDLGSGSWALRFLGKFVAVSTGAARGMLVTVRAGGNRYDVWFSGGGLVVTQGAGGVALHSAPGAVTTGPKFGQWTLGVDARNRFFAEVNGSKVIDGVAGVSTPTSDPDALVLTVDTTGGAQGATEVYLNRLELARGVDTEWYEPGLQAAVMPQSDAHSIAAVVSLPGVDPAELATGALSIQLTLAKDDGAGKPGDVLASATMTATSPANPVTLDPAGYHGEVHVVGALMRGAEIVYQRDTRYALPQSHSAAAVDDSIAPSAGESVLFTDVDACVTPDGSGPFAAGWTMGTYSLDGSDQGGVFLDSTATAQQLRIPLRLRGWCAVYIGFVSGAQEFTFGVGDAVEPVSVYGAGAFDAAQAFGARATGEVLARTAHFGGEALTIAPVTGKQARIAYLRVVGLTAEQEAVASRPSEPDIKRVIYNNDGYSLFSRGVPDAQTLQEEWMDIYANADVEALTFQSGTTFFLNYVSEYAGVPYESLTPAQEALMRTVDKAIKTSLDGFVARGEIPAEVVAARGKQIGVKTYSGLRMDIMYKETQAPWLNGNHYDVFKPCLAENYDGTVNPNFVSYVFPQVREYVTNIVVEQSHFTDIAGVDLDFCRYPNVVGYEKGLVDAYASAYGADARTEVTPEGSLRWQRFRAAYVTDMMRGLRAALGATTVIARIPIDDALAYGLDVPTWVSEGLIDVLVASAVYSEPQPFWGDLDVYPKMVEGTPIKVYGGTTGTLGGTDVTKADEAAVSRGFPSSTGHTTMDPLMYQERASQFYRAGYDGMYVFNDPSGVGIIGQLGDRVANEKWRVFELPAIWIQDFATARPVPTGTLEELDRQLSQSRTSGAISDSEWHRLDAQVRLARRMIANGSRTRAAAAVGRFVAELRRARDGGECPSSVAGSLIATAHVAMVS